MFPICQPMRIWWRGWKRIWSREILRVCVILTLFPPSASAAVHVSYCRSYAHNVRVGFAWSWKQSQYWLLSCSITSQTSIRLCGYPFFHLFISSLMSSSFHDTVCEGGRRQKLMQSLFFTGNTEWVKYLKTRVCTLSLWVNSFIV